MGHLKLDKISLVCVLCLIGAQGSFSKILDQMPPRYVAERGLAGLRVKLTDNFTVGAWGALYYGSQQVPDRFRFDPFRFQGFDAVPGFDCGLGTILNKVKVNAGGDLYCQVRYWRKDDGSTRYEFRPRGNLGFTVPVAGTGSFQWIQRVERQIQTAYYESNNRTDHQTYFRIRSMVKLSGPKFTTLKISPYAAYESFNGTVPYYYEAEFGITLAPIKNMSISISDMICSVTETPNSETHQICLYIFYTIDAVNQFSKFMSSIRSPGF